MIKQKTDRDKYKQALVRVIAPYAFWSYAVVDPAEVSNENLIEAVLLYGNDPLKLRLFSIFSRKEIQEVWEQKLVIRDSRLYDLNRKIASDFLHLSNPELHIRQAYQKHNLYDRFSA